MPGNNLFDVVVRLKMQNRQNIEVLWSFVGVQCTHNAAWWETTIHKVLKINLYAQGAFLALRFSFYCITGTLKIFFLLIKQRILFLSLNEELGAKIGLWKGDKVDSDPFSRRY